MITEKQKKLIFDINCFYQLESQKNNFNRGQPIAFLPELGLIAMQSNTNRQSIDWSNKYNELKLALIEHGLSNSWTLVLQQKLAEFITKGNTIEDFRNQFLTSIDLLINMVLLIINNANPSIPAEEIAENVINDIFEKDYWDGPIIEKINIVRKLSITLGFDNKFLVEFGKTLVNNY